jgi:hypothetical protein
MRNLMTALLALVAAVGAQNYKCNWSVVGMGGGEMSSGAYTCVATAGQTAAGFMTSPDYWALVGYWLPEGQTGVQEPAQPPSQGPLVTRLYAPKPNPFRGGVAIRYSLAVPGRASVQLCDLAGRVVRTLANGQQKPGSYSVRWDGRDNAGRTLAAGVYFCKFSAGDYRATQKLVVQRWRVESRERGVESSGTERAGGGVSSSAARSVTVSRATG